MKLIRKAIFAIVCTATVAFQNANADLSPTPLSGDARLVEFDYNEESIYLVLTRPLAVTNIVMPAGEKIRLLKAGDTFSFHIEADNARREIFIKPKFEGVETTMTVATTNKRFQFVIRSTGKSLKYYQQVSFSKEQETLFEFGEEAPATELSKYSSDTPTESSATTRVNPADLNTEYTITGDAKFKPEIVYDNGKFIWLKFPQNLTELPAIFAKDNQGIYLVNYVPEKNNVIVIQQMVDELVLKIDSNEVSVRKGKKGFFGWSN
ncbi:TrbG/VirB9 family P-type conjugative transfer protein (plasmid) [Comamonas aquatica]|nr:TrbG/VirB9 family P-type conjugative transfer protein [Comamonas aquatica]